MASFLSQLPSDILGSIFERLSLLDHVRLACVCVSWRSALRSINTFRPAPQPPWLMLLAGPHQDPKTANFLRLSDKRVFNIPHQPDLPIQSRAIIGSSMGWLITADERSELHLLNPLTRTQINLPPVATLPHVETFGRRITRYVKAILVPSSQSSTTSHHGFCDAIYHKGQCYTLDRLGNVEAWDLSSPSSPKSTFRGPKFEGGVYGEVRYLVESSSGDLLQVHIFEHKGYFVIGFKAFKMDLTEFEWVRVRGLGNEALFLGTSHSTSLSNFPELRGNTIYFPAVLADGYFHRMICGAGIFNLEDKSIEEGFCLNRDSYKSPLPIWITPSMF